MVREIEKNCLNKLISSTGLEKEIQCKREVQIIEDCIKESTLDIWGIKSMFFPEINQYEIYKCFILKFEFSFAGFINSKVDCFHYTLKKIAYCDKIELVNADNIKEFFESGMIVDKHTSTEFVKKHCLKMGIDI